jgi:signal transduction histidine kinase
MLVLLASGAIVFYRVQAEIEKEVARRLKGDVDYTAELIQNGISIDSLRSGQIDIKELNIDAPLVPFEISDSMGYYSHSRRALDRKFSVGASYKINQKHYYISTYNFIAEPDEILEGILASSAVTLVALLLFVGVTSRLMSTRILSNFNQTLKTVQAFSLKQKQRMRLGDTRTQEFKALNQFLERMTNKALDDYQSLKEFSENASHELQTPLSIIRGKLELLLETNIDENQATLIEGVQNAVQKLSAINQSLVLLTKVENQEYDLNHTIHLSSMIENSIVSFRELIELKNIGLTLKIEPDVYIQLNPVLAEILFTNLFSNAIRHNFVNGSIYVELTSYGLIVKNTGETPEIDRSELFKRFKKDRQNTESIGLGLAIVKQICDLNNFSVRYTFENALHVLSINFLPAK